MTTAIRAAVTWRAAVDDAPVDLTAGGGLLAVGGADGTAWVLQAADGRPAGTVTLPGGILDLAFSPDGSHLLLTGPQGYALWHAADSRHGAGHRALVGAGQVGRPGPGRGGRRAGCRRARRGRPGTMARR